MNLENAKLAYLACPAEIQGRILARFAFHLTILARGTYEVGTERVLYPVILRKINELQHRVTSQIYSLLTADPQRYSDEEILKIAVHPVGLPTIESAFIESVSRVCQKIDSPPSTSIL